MATRRPPDSSDEEATALDLGSLGPSSKADKGSRPPPAISAKPHKGAARPLDRSEDEEATEFLVVRPTSAGPSGAGSDAAGSSLRARGRAVPLEGEASRSAPSAASAAPAPEPSSSPSRAAPKKSSPADAPPARLPARTPRPLPGERQTNVRSETQSMPGQASSLAAPPRITRIEGGARPSSPTHPDIGANTDADADITAPPLALPAPKARPLPQRAQGPAATVGDNDRQLATVIDEPDGGTLIIEVPQGAVIFVNGVERGRGPALKVSPIDRFAKHTLRIHAPGHLAWSGSVCLEGRMTAKVRPPLKPKR